MKERFKFLRRPWHSIELDAVLYAVGLAVILIAAAIANVVARF